MLKLYIGNKNYSSGPCAPGADAPKRHQLRRGHTALRQLCPNSSFKLQTLALAPTGKVPLLADESLVIWDSLAICEYLAERFPDKHLWPQTVAQRARAQPGGADA